MYAENLKKLRKVLNLSVENLSKEIDIPASTIWGYESKKRTPSIDLPIQLYRKYNINLNWFLMGEGEMFNKEYSKTNNSRFEIEQIVLQILQQKGIISE